MSNFGKPGRCVRCTRFRAIYCRKMCKSCYNTERYAGKLCVHCGEKPVGRSRGLRFRCFYDPAVRDLYPPKQAAHIEPTAEELDAMIAERMKHLPDWWCAETRRERKRRKAGLDPREG